MTRQSKITTAVVIVLAGIFVWLVIWTINSAKPPKDAIQGDPTKLVRSTSHKTGSGPVQVVEYGDFQCPVCGAAEPGVEQLLKDYNGKITFYFRNFPLGQHENADAAALAAEAAALQGKYWEMHDKLYAAQKQWAGLMNPTDTFVGYAESLGGMDIQKFRSDLTSKDLEHLISQDYADGLVHGVQGTPTFFINGKTFSGPPTSARLSRVIDAQLPASSKTSPSVSPAP